MRPIQWQEEKPTLIELHLTNGESNLMFGGETLYAGSETEKFDALSLVNLEHVNFEIYEDSFNAIR